MWTGSTEPGLELVAALSKRQAGWTHVLQAGLPPALQSAMVSRGRRRLFPCERQA